MNRSRDAYAFPELPIEPVDAGTNLLLTGPPLVGTQRLLLSMVSGADEREGMLLVSVDEDGVSVIEDYESTGRTFDPGRMRVVDCTEHSPEPTDAVRQVSGPADLTGIGIEFSSLYESLRAGGIERARIGLYSIPTLLAFAEDFRAVYRFLHTITGRIRTADGLGVFAVDPDAIDDEAYATVAQAFDARVEIREREFGAEFRVRGLSDQSDSWHPVG
ncbi:KaiC-like protein ATPase [Halapricum desulfuricans]|uniref:KaiC-like protein ATPase n=2 Tax=Halapricum desulfuricans TaxID=2841257 RepID=A0A897N4Q9_9EURY|nr:KaiC-like protein ATPase [Halapricum desulfuricans]